MRRTIDAASGGYTTPTATKINDYPAPHPSAQGALACVAGLTYRITPRGHRKGSTSVLRSQPSGEMEIILRAGCTTDSKAQVTP